MAVLAASGNVTVRGELVYVGLALAFGLAAAWPLARRERDWTEVVLGAFLVAVATAGGPWLVFLVALAASGGGH